MKAALLVEPRRIVIDEIPAPRPGVGEVLIQPIRVGICGSDVSFYQGHRTLAYPFVLGHEVVGYVLAIGERVANVKVGQRVIVEPNYPCGQCTFCCSGRGAICPQKTSLGVTVSGCFAEAFVAPAEFVWAVPENILDADAVAIEPLAVSLHALGQSRARMGDTIAVLGCGSTGLLLIHAAVAQGIRVLAHDKLADKLAFAQQLGAVPVQANDVAQLWREESVTTVFECAGVVATVELALSAAPRGSEVMLMGLATSPASFVPFRLVREGIRVSTSLIYDHPTDFARTIALVQRGILHPSRIITNTLPFDAMDRALQLASTGQAGKVVAVM